MRSMLTISNLRFPIYAHRFILPIESSHSRRIICATIDATTPVTVTVTITITVTNRGLPSFRFDRGRDSIEEAGPLSFLRTSP